MKLNIRKILVPTDFSATGQLALEHAAFMARLFKAELFLLHAIEISDTTFGIYEPAIVLPDLGEISAIANERLAQLSATIKKQYGVKINALCREGIASAEIAQVVKEYKIDLVVMGTHGAKGFNEYFIGSNTHRTVTLCPCPVISVQSHAKRLGFGKIVLPIDNSAHSRQKVDQVISIAKKYASKIFILGLPGDVDATERRKFNLKLESVQKAIEKAGLTWESRISKGDNPAMEALKYSKKIKADLIAVLSGDESNLSGIHLGPFSRQIVNHSRIPVLTIREETGKYAAVSLAAAPLY